MTLTLMYITNLPSVAGIAEAAGVDQIFVDLELNGKHARQGHLDTVISRHSLNDVRNVAEALTTAELLVRVNPIYAGSSEEIDQVIEAGAQVVMLPYFKTSDEVMQFVRLVHGRARVCLLLETPEAVAELGAILAIDGVDSIHIGLNDLHLGYNLRFMFELLTDGTVERLCAEIGEAGLPFGFGGIAKLGEGALPAESVVAEHYRLGSSMVILSRAFCDLGNAHDLITVRKLFMTEVARIRALEQALASESDDFFEDNRQEVVSAVQGIVKHLTDGDAAVRSRSQEVGAGR